MKMFKEAYPTYECLGWYTTGSRIDPNVDTLIHAMVGNSIKGDEGCQDDGCCLLTC